MRVGLILCVAAKASEQAARACAGLLAFPGRMGACLVLEPIGHAGDTDTAAAARLGRWLALGSAAAAAWFWAAFGNWAFEAQPHGERNAPLLACLFLAGIWICVPSVLGIAGGMGWAACRSARSWISGIAAGCRAEEDARRRR